MSVTKGSTNQTVYFYIVGDAGSSAPGEPVTGLLFSDIETGGSASYMRVGAVRVDMTLITQTVAGAHADGGFVEVDATNMPGVYRCDYVDAAFVTGVNEVTCQIVVAPANNAVAAPIRVELTGFDLQSAVASANLLQIAGATATLDNFDNMYNGTGYNDPTSPSSRSQLDNIGNVGAASHKSVIAAPGGFVLTTGSEVNDEDATVPLDGVKHELSDTAGTLDAKYKFQIGGDSVPVSITFTGNFNSNNDSFDIFGNTGSDGTPVWIQIGTIEGVNSADNTVHTLNMFGNMLVTDILGEVQVRVQATGLTSASFDVDQVFVSVSDTSRSVGYALGRIWINTGLSNTNTEPFVDGTADNPVSTLAAALTLSANPLVGLTDFHMINGSSITFTALVTNFSFFGDNWSLSLAGQNIDGLHCEGAIVSGIGVGTGLDLTFVECHIGTVTLPDRTTLRRCSLESTVLTVPVGDLFLHMNYMGTPSGVVPILDFGAAVGNSDVHMHAWAGRVEFRNLGQLGTDAIHLDGQGLVTFNANCVGGTINWRGLFGLVNNGSGITINDNARFDQLQIADALKLAPTAGSPAAGSVNNDLDDMKGATFATGTDSLEAIRNRGDVAWITGAAGSGLTALASGTAQVSAAGTLVFAASSTFANDEMKGNVAKITAGTGAGQSRLITAYVGATDTATVTPDWTTTPDATSVYEIVDGPADVRAIAGSADSAVKLRESTSAIINSSATGVPTTTTMPDSSLTEATNDHYNGSVLIWTSGVAKDIRASVTGYNGATKTFTFAAVATAAVSGDTYILV